MVHNVQFARHLALEVDPTQRAWTPSVPGTVLGHFGPMFGLFWPVFGPGAIGAILSGNVTIDESRRGVQDAKPFLFNGIT